jgi:DNA-binding response OmpR family regulator
MQHNPSQRILFVSNTRLSVSLRRKLNARGFAVTLESTGREAVDQLTRSSFDIIVFDLVSTANANELIKRIRKVATFRAIPIIVVGDWGTGAGFAGAISRCRHVCTCADRCIAIN